MKIETKFNPDGTLKSLEGNAPNLNALAWLCVNVIYKEVRLHKNPSG